MFAHEKFNIYDAIVSALESDSLLTYSPLIRAIILFQLTNTKAQKDLEIPQQRLRLNGVNAEKLPEKRAIHKVGFISAQPSDDDFFKNVIKEFERQGVEVEKLPLPRKIKRVGLSNKQKEEIDFFERNLNDFYGSSLRGELESHFSRFNGLISNYYEILNKKKMDALMLRCFYNPAFFPAIFASKMLGITVIDIQHGIQSPAHLGYSNFRKTEAQSPLLPDIFWVWSDMAATLLNQENALSQHAKIVNGGNPIFTETPDFNSANIVRSKKKILYTHQPLTKNVPIPIEEIKLVYRRSKRPIAVRPHPLHIQEGIMAMEMLKKEAIKCYLEDPRKIPINDSLAETAFHVTHGSTCVLDALNFGVSSLYVVDRLNEIEEKCKTGLLLKIDDIGKSLPNPDPKKAIDYSLGSKAKISYAVSAILAESTDREAMTINRDDPGH